MPVVVGEAVAGAHVSVAHGDRSSAALTTFPPIACPLASLRRPAAVHRQRLPPELSGRR
jgi:hypothetical protein